MNFGFSLIELLIAMSIFALIAIISYSSLDTVLQTNVRNEQYANRLADLQITFNRLQFDIEQYINRDIINEFGEKQAALLGSEKNIEFTRTGWNNPLQQPRSDLQRVTYYLEEQILYRNYWQLLDRLTNSQAIKNPILNKVKDLSIRYYDQNLQWHTSFSSFDKELKIKAVEITIELIDWGKIKRFFILNNN
jgi:general secretion pathway protein J